MKQNNSHILISILTIFSLWAVFLLQLVVRVKAIKDDYALYTAIFVTIMILIIVFAVVFKTKPYNKKLAFNKPMLISWVLMCLLMLYSDIIVFKVYWFLSLILLILFTGLFFVFNTYTSEMRDRLWGLFIIAVELAFAGATVFCFLFRPYTVGIRYSGLSANPNVYAMFLISVWICVTARLEITINECKKTITALIPGIEAGCALFFLYMTGARTSFLAICFVSFVWIIFRLYYSRKERKPVLRYLITAVCGLIPAAILSYFILSTLPGIINHPVTFERDRLFTALEYDGNLCFAAGEDSTAVDNLDDTTLADDTSLIARIKKALSGNASLDEMLNGRITIYKSYIKKLNNDGHRKYNKKVKGENAAHAHNNIIQMAYTYGKPAGLMYVIVLILSVYYSVRLYIISRNKRRTAILPMLIVAGFLMTSMTESILLPMQSLLAFAYYLAVGELINTKYYYKTK